jgi:hypothetical protein
MEVPRNVQGKKGTKVSFGESLLQILQQQKAEDAYMDENKTFLMPLLLPFKKFNDQQ